MSNWKSAEESRQDFAKRKENIGELLQNTINYYEEAGQDKEKDIFRKLKDDLKNGEFSIVVVGEFSAGKSTLLNALMRKRLLPSYSGETTATVNFLRHRERAKEEEAGRVFYHDGSQITFETADLETITQYVSTKGKAVAQTVDHLDLYLDSEFLKDGVTLVDSPGLNGVADGHREITEAQIMKSHASIFVFNSDHPGSKTDFEFLGDLQKRVKTILFVLNKADLIKKDEGETVESVIETLKRSYKTQFPEVKEIPEIWPVAAYPALVARNPESMEYHGKKNLDENEKNALEEQSKLKAFEDRLLHFLTCGEKTCQELMAPLERVIVVTGKSRDQYEDEIRLLESKPDADQIDEQIVGIKENISQLEEKIGERKKEVSSQTYEVFESIREELGTKMIRLQERELGKIDRINDSDELTEYLNSFEKKFLRTVERYVREADSDVRRKLLGIVKAQYGREAENIEQNLSEDHCEIKIQLENHLQSEEGIFEVGLEEMNEKIRQYEDKLSQLKEDEDNLHENYMETRAHEKKKKEMEARYQELCKSREDVKKKVLPAIDHYTEEVRDTQARGGVLGSVADFLVGEKPFIHYVRREDKSSYESALEEKNRELKDLNDAIKEAERKIEGMTDGNSELAQYQLIRKREEIEEATRRLNQMMEDETKKIERKYEKKVRKLKRKLNDFCDEITEESNERVKRELEQSRVHYVNLILAALEASLRKEMEEEEKRLRHLQERLEASEKDREQRLSELRDRVEKINELLGEASDLQTDLEEMEKARVEYTAV